MLLKVFGKAIQEENQLEAWAEPAGRTPATKGRVAGTKVSSLDFQNSPSPYCRGPTSSLQTHSKQKLSHGPSQTEQPCLRLGSWWVNHSRAAPAAHEINSDGNWMEPAQTVMDSIMPLGISGSARGEAGHRCSKLEVSGSQPLCSAQVRVPQATQRLQSTVAITDKTSEHSSFPSRSWIPLNDSFDAFFISMKLSFKGEEKNQMNQFLHFFRKAQALGSGHGSHKCMIEL